MKHLLLLGALALLGIVVAVLVALETRPIPAACFAVGKSSTLETCP